MDVVHNIGLRNVKHFEMEGPDCDENTRSEHEVEWNWFLTDPPYDIYASTEN
jgi:phage terminase large subunit-like protein